MKFSSPKDERKEKGSDEHIPLVLSTMKNESMIPREKQAYWPGAINQYPVEIFGVTKAFSPVITPRKKRKGPEGESVWKTPNSKHFGSADRQSLHIGTPDYQ
jgi:hypothetical protein